MKCPKCGKELKMVSTDKERYYYSHNYSIAYAMSDKPMCDYTVAINREPFSKGIE